MAFGTRTVYGPYTGTTTSTTFAGSSFTPNANKLLLCFCWIASATTTHLEPTLAGQSLTWTRRASVESAANNRFALAVFSAISTGSPSAGALTTTWVAAGLRHGQIIVEFDGQHATTPFTQTKVNNGTGTSPVVTLDVTPAADSLIFGAINARQDAANLTTPGASWTELADVVVGTGAPYAVGQVQEDLNSADTTVEWTITSSTNWVALAIEIAIAAAGGGGATKQMMHLKRLNQ